MSPELLSGIIGAIVTLIGAVAAFLAKSRLSDVITSGSKREETAVEKMAGLLESSASRDEKREAKLLEMLDKAMDTVTKLTQNMTQIALQLQGHEHSENLRWSQDLDMNKNTQTTLEDIKKTLSSLEKLITDLAVELLAERRQREKLEKERDTDEN